VAPLIAAVKNKEPVFLGKPTANMINCISQKLVIYIITIILYINNKKNCIFSDIY